MTRAKPIAVYFVLLFPSKGETTFVLSLRDDNDDVDQLSVVSGIYFHHSFIFISFKARYTKPW